MNKVEELVDRSQGKIRADVAHRKLVAMGYPGSKDPQLLAIRLFDEPTKRAAYEQQTTKAKAVGVSNCALCAHGDNANKTRTYAQQEMDADHVTAWSKGCSTDLTNCEMLCVMHNRSKGNR